MWHGIRCGVDLKAVQWTGVYVATTNDGRPVPNCYTSVARDSYAVGTALGDAVFGRCGVAPTKAPSLPTRVCDAPGDACVPAGQVGRFVVQTTSISGCGVTAKSATYSGQPCGPGGRLVQWSSFAIPNAAGQLTCRQSAKGQSNPMYDREWFGTCGVPPYWFRAKLPYRICGTDNGGSPPAPAPAPTPAPAPAPAPAPPPGSGGGGRIARQELRAGERSLPGMERIRALVNGQVPAYSAGSAVVAVLDTGGTNLPDLNVKTGLSFVGGSLNNNWQDRQNHGTHVSR